MTISYRTSLITAITCWVATFAALSLHLDNPWWATISAWVIANPDRDAFWQKGVLRICGTLAGCALGYELAILLVGRPVLQATCFFMLGFCSSYMRFRSRFGYAWTLGGIAALLLMSISAWRIDSFLVWSVFLILGIAGFSRLHLSDSRWAYTGTQGGLAFITALVTGNGPPDTIDPIVNRICGITIGVLIFMGIVFIVRLSQTRMQATRQGI